MKSAPTLGSRSQDNRYKSYIWNNRINHHSYSRLFFPKMVIITSQCTYDDTPLKRSFFLWNSAGLWPQRRGHKRHHTSSCFTQDTIFWFSCAAGWLLLKSECCEKLPRDHKEKITRRDKDAQSAFSCINCLYQLWSQSTGKCIRK